MKWLFILFLCMNLFAQYPKYPTRNVYPNYEKIDETYNPIDANTTYFWRADQGVTLVSTKISQWDDQIGTFDFLQATDGNRPVFNTDSTALYFQHANSTFMATASSPTMNYTAFSIDFYVNIPNKDTAQTILCEYQGSTTLWAVNLNATGNGNIGFIALVSSVNIHATSVSSTNFTAGKRNCFTIAILAGTDDQWYVNGSEVASTDAYNVASDFNNTGTLRIGKQNTTSYFRGWIYAIRISNKVRSEAEHEAFYAWCQETF